MIYAVFVSGKDLAIMELAICRNLSSPTKSTEDSKIIIQTQGDVLVSGDELTHA
jgi:hypothetical protein